MNMLRRFFRDERGLELSEYAIMAALIIIMAVGVILAVGTKIKNVFKGLDSQLGTVPTTPTP